MQRISWLFLLAVAHGVRAQANVSGVVRDSIARGPLAGAIVQLVSAEDASRFARSTASDSLGRFAFSEVPSGRYTLGFFHPRLDSLGVDAAAREVLVSGRSDVHADLAIPGPLRLGRAICRNALRDSSGVVVGVVRDARTLNPVAKANVVGEWLELAFTTQGVVRRMPRLVATTGDNGWFALCNVPSGGTIALAANHEADSTDRIDFFVPREGFAERNLYLGSAAGTGRVSGVVVTAADAKPLSGAQVSIKGAAPAKANDAGVWTIADAPLGTHFVEVRAIGYYPERRAVDVVGEMAPMRIALSTMKAVLDTVKVNATHVFDREIAAFEKRRRSGLGKYLTREDIARRNPLRLSDLLVAIGGVHIDRSDNDSTSILVRGVQDLCVPALFIDGRQIHALSVDELDDFVQPREVSGIELYVGANAPPQFQTPLGGCGSLVIWTR
ncbi:MAG TPA: carboxypeptidase regulatory-like domain-containing protein [Gemmatimonadaceae bacterium]|nr:carboxypeptidase regulatory-like domain-containing protein [Gemmatimonadaceae bacterium]